MTNKSEPNLVRKQLLIMRDKVSKFIFIFFERDGSAGNSNQEQSFTFFSFFKTRMPRGRILGAVRISVS